MQRDYFDHFNCIGWTREGLGDKPNSGCAAVLSNIEAGFKSMEMGQHFKGKTFVDLLENYTGEVIINDEGWGEFHVSPDSVSVWIEKANAN